jgi:hypothetical protein
MRRRRRKETEKRAEKEKQETRRVRGSAPRNTIDKTRTGNPILSA